MLRVIALLAALISSWPAFADITIQPSQFALPPGLVQAVDQNAPPGSPTQGQAWLVGASPTGAFAGHANAIAVRRASDWAFYPPACGWLAFNLGTGLEFRYNCTSWAALGVGAPATIVAAGITDSSVTGRGCLTGDAAACRAAIGLSVVQAYHALLADIAGTSFSSNDLIQYRSGHLINRTPAQVAADMEATIAATGHAFTAAQTITTSGIGGNLGVVSTDVDANFGPELDCYRNSATPAIFDGLCSYSFYGNDSGGNKTIYGAVRAQVEDTTDGSEDAVLHMYVERAGSNGIRGDWRDGLVVGPSATGGDQGAGTVNVDTGYFIDGINLTASFQAADADLDSVALGYSGALVFMNADLTAQNYTSATAVPFNDEDNDVGNWHNTSSNTSRLTVPSGVSAVHLCGKEFIALGTAGDSVTISFRKNGSTTYAGFMAHTGSFTATGSTQLSVCSPRLTVTAGDYFEMFIGGLSDASVTLTSGSSLTWFSAEAVR